MTPINQIPAVCNYGTSAVYSDYPSEEQLRAGVVPLDSLPAAWWNKMWCATNGAINEARDMVGQLITEINSVLAQAGVCPASACTDQLYQSINLIRQRLATASVPGSVVSSSAAGAVNVAQDGTMSVNCLGNIAALTTATSTIVGAINELKTTYDNCFTSVGGAIDTLSQSKAPVGHASTQNTYGVGNASCYGHVKLSDTFTEVLAACEGVAASQCALATVYTCIQASASLGNTVACPLGIASAGCCATAARSDHVHPTTPVCMICTFQDIIGICWDGLCKGVRYQFAGTEYDRIYPTVCCWQASSASQCENHSFNITDAYIQSILACRLSTPFIGHFCTRPESAFLLIPLFYGYSKGCTMDYGWRQPASMMIYNCSSYPIFIQGDGSAAGYCGSAYVNCNHLRFTPPGCCGGTVACSQNCGNGFGSVVSGTAHACAYLVYTPTCCAAGQEPIEVNWEALAGHYLGNMSGIRNQVDGTGALGKCLKHMLYTVGSSLTFCPQYIPGTVYPYESNP